MFSKEENELLNDIVDDLCEGVIEKIGIKNEGDAVMFLNNHVKGAVFEALEKIWVAVYPADKEFPHDRIKEVADAQAKKWKPNETDWGPDVGKEKIDG